jgi:large subunit ribosomal protein L32
MAVPKKRTSSAKRNMRRSHHARRPLRLSACANCGTWVMPHTACTNCGRYRGREVMNVLKKVERNERKRKAKARSQNE